MLKYGELGEDVVCCMVWYVCICCGSVGIWKEYSWWCEFRDPQYKRHRDRRESRDGQIVVYCSKWISVVSVVGMCECWMVVGCCQAGKNYNIYMIQRTCLLFGCTALEAVAFWTAFSSSLIVWVLSVGEANPANCVQCGKTTRRICLQNWFFQPNFGLIGLRTNRLANEPFSVVRTSISAEGSRWIARCCAWWSVTRSEVVKKACSLCLWLGFSQRRHVCTLTPYIQSQQKKNH